MAANLPPQFFKLQEALKKAKEPQKKILILEEMLSICPKHKGTERVQEDLKRKIAKLKKQKPKKRKVKSLFFIKKEGAGQVIIIGPPNSGKSSLLNALTQAKAKVADYPFSTTFYQAGMMPFENIFIQIVDTPPLTEFSPFWMKNLVKNSDGILAIFDLSNEDFKIKMKKIKKILDSWQIEKDKIIFIGNKIDLSKAKENLEKFKSLEIIPISAKEKIGLLNLKKKIFNLLKIIRVYSKFPKRFPDFQTPFVIRKGTNLFELANKIHKDLALTFKYVKLFKKDLKKPKIVGKDYLLEDQDIIEIHG